MESVELSEKIKKLKYKIKKLNENSKNLEILIQKADEEISNVIHLKSSSNPREKMEYLEAVRVRACLKSDLVNNDLLITFNLDDLLACQEKLKLLNEKELTM